MMSKSSTLAGQKIAQKKTAFQSGHINVKDVHNDYVVRIQIVRLFVDDTSNSHQKG